MRLLSCALACSLVSVFACSSSERAGIEVSFSLASPALVPGAADDGRAIVLQHGSLALGTVELRVCKDDQTLGSSSTDGLSVLHVEGSPTRLGISAIRTLASAEVGADLGTLAPPPGRYCAVRQSYFAADDDAVGLTDENDVGQTLRLVGTVGGEPFELRSEVSVDVDVPLDPPLELSLEGTRTAAFRLTLRPLDAAFAGVTFTPARSRDDANTVLATLQGVLDVQRAP